MLKQHSNNERREREERHRQEMEEFRDNYEGEARVEAERNLMKVVLPELQRSIMISHTKMQRDFSRQMEEKNREIKEKDREMERLRQDVRELREAHILLEERQVRDRRDQKVLVGVLSWLRRHSSGWLLHNLRRTADPGLLAALSEF